MGHNKKEPLCKWGDPDWGCDCTLIAEVRADEREKARTRVSLLTYWIDYSIADEQRIVSLDEVFAAIADDRSLWEDQGVPAPWTKDGIEYYYGEQP